MALLALVVLASIVIGGVGTALVMRDEPDPAISVAECYFDRDGLTVTFQYELGQEVTASVDVLEAEVVVRLRAESSERTYEAEGLTGELLLRGVPKTRRVVDMDRNELDCIGEAQ